MRERFLFGVGLVALLVACGGSSSETPPPLQPDPKGFHYASPSPPLLRAEQADAGSGAPRSDEDESAKPASPDAIKQ